MGSEITDLPWALLTCPLCLFSDVYSRYLYMSIISPITLSEDRLRAQCSPIIISQPLIIELKNDKTWRLLFLQWDLILHKEQGQS